MDIFYISPFVLLKFSLSSFILLQTSHRSLHHSFLPKLSFHLLSSCFTHFFPFFSAAMQHLFHCLIQHLFVFYFNQQTAFSIFYAFPAARDIACDNRGGRLPLLPGGRCSCLHDSWEERHSLLLHKMGAGLTESRKNGRFQAVPVLLPAFL